MTSSSALDDYVLLGRSGLRVSPMCLGAMTFGEKWGFGNSLEESKKVFDHYYEKGGNFIDTANIYTEGDSERFLGEYVSGKRSTTVLASKYTFAPFMAPAENKHGKVLLSGNSRKSLVENIDGSLKRLGTGYLDVLYVHAWEYRTPVEEVMRALDDVVRSGKVLYVGISDAPSWVVSNANTVAHFRGWSPFIALQTRYNLLDRSYEFDYAPMAAEFGLSTVAWGAIAEGFLSGKYKRGATSADSTRTMIDSHLKADRNWEILDVVTKIATDLKRTPVQVALNWMLQKGVNPLIGAKTEAQLKDNLGALEFTLTPEQMAALDAVSKPQNVPFGSHAWAKTSLSGPFSAALSGGYKIAYPAHFKSFF